MAVEKMTELQRLGRPRMKLNIHENQNSMKANKSLQRFRFGRTRSRWKDEQVRMGERHRWSTLCRKLEPGIAPSRLKAHIIRESYVTGKVLPSMRQQPANVNTDKTEMDLALLAGKHRPDYGRPPKAIFISSSFSGDVTLHQDNHTLFADHVKNDLHHWLTHRRCEHRLVIMNREKQAQDKEPPRDCRNIECHDDINWSRYSRVVVYSVICALARILNIDEKTDELCATYLSECTERREFR
jgi:hypothetical protein